ncbi:hypothetical protein EUX98_g9003 [Antrodiella citrinella]|uniref:Uncharacterized protein n=1 Tax=Antrodiella citrinella TaxID=2447956 RepID=A0A4S4LZW2_9APHY|nr:hypothetical protein EUX98_g9003 [Antrodiella citrinella]
MAKACNEMNIPDLLGIMSALAVAHANRTIQNVRPNEQHTKELRDLEAALKEAKSG